MFTNQDSKGLLEGASPKVAFLLGLCIGIAVLSIVTLFVVLASNASGDGVAKKTTAAAAAPAPTPTPTPSPAAPAPTIAKSLPPVTDDDHVRGNPDAPVTIVEYSDFECPFCGRFHPTVKQVLDTYGDKVRWVYRHFPLSFHPQAEPAAIASECAAEQGKFWEFADVMFANQTRLGADFFKSTAESLKFNMNQFNDCVSSQKYLSKINAQSAGGSSAGVSGTPGSFVNGYEVSGAVPFESLKAVIDQQLQK